MELVQIHSIIKIIFLTVISMTTSLGSGYANIYTFGLNSDGKSYTSVNGTTPTVKEIGSNSYWKTSPTTNMIFSELFRGGGTNLGAKSKNDDSLQ